MLFQEQHQNDDIRSSIPSLLDLCHFFLLSGFTYTYTGDQDKQSHEGRYQLNELNQALSI